MRVLITAFCIFIAAPAHAQYSTSGSDCDPLAVHVPSADVAVVDGFDHRGNAIAPADGSPSVLAKQFETNNISLDIPITNYVNQNNYNADLSESRINIGTITSSKDGGVALNSEPIAPQNIYSTECK